eukprot:3467196-Amphidinium_carterae.1
MAHLATSFRLAHKHTCAIMLEPREQKVSELSTPMADSPAPCVRHVGEELPCETDKSANCLH